MEINALTLVLIVIIATLAIAGSAIAFAKLRKQNPNQKVNETFIVALDKIRPIMSELFINIFTIYQADKLGYDGLVNFSIDYVYNRIQNADFLYPEEKELLTKDVIRTILEPKLKELYEEKINI